MKKRIGFVSNSSTSSFLCEVSGNIVAERDIGLEEAGMYECCAGHVFSEEFLVSDASLTDVQRSMIEDLQDCIREIDADENPPEWRLRERRGHKEQIEWIEQYGVEGTADQFILDHSEEYDDYGDGRYNVATALCPICTMTHVGADDILNFLLARLGVDREFVVEKLKQNYTSQAALYKDIEEVRANPSPLGIDLLAEWETNTPPGFNLEKS